MKTQVWALMSHIKLGDFLLLTPILSKIEKQHTHFYIAVPDILWELYEDLQIFSRAVSYTQFSRWCDEGKIVLDKIKIIDLSFPLLSWLKLPEHHQRLPVEPFFLAQHITQSYAQALTHFFPDFSMKEEVKPYLHLSPDESILKEFSLQAFSYFTIHSGSDHPPKNWPSANFRSVAEQLLAKYPQLYGVNIVGPKDDDWMKEHPLQRMISVHTSLKKVAHLLAGSLFHVDNDSGIQHLAGVLDVPSITVFGPTPPGSWRSLTSSQFIHWGGLLCHKECEGAGMDHCEQRVCLSSIKPEHLVETAEQIISLYQHL